MVQFETLAEVNDLVIARGGNKVLCYSTETFDGALIVKNPLVDDNYTLACTCLLTNEYVKDEHGATLTEKYFNHFSKLYESILKHNGEVTYELWVDGVVANGSAEDFKTDYYVDLEQKRQEELEHMSVYDLDDEISDEELVPDSQILSDCFLPEYLHALNMQDISVWFK